MIYDLGCVNSGLPDKILQALPGAIATLAVIAGLALIGSIPKRGGRFEAQDIFSGWGAASALMTLAAISSAYALPFAVFALFLLAAAAAISAVKRQYFGAPFWMLALFPGLFILVAINIAGVAKWDDFSHWVPNELYLYHFDSIPALGLPPPRSAWPGYPYALPFLSYMASWLAGGFVMQGGAMANFLLLLAFASMLADLSPSKSTFSAAGKTALALLLVTLANPGFNASFSITNQGDTATSVLVAALALMLWKMSGQLPSKNKKDMARLGLPLMLTSIALISVKQSNLAVLGLLLIGFLIVAAKNRILKPALVLALLMFVPAFALRFIWQSYVDAEMATARIFHMRALSEWRFDLAPAILHAMLKAMIKANGLSLMMLGVTIYGVISIFRPPTPRRNFAIMAGTVYGGYLAFLFTTYIGASFSADEAERATSFFRYCTHTSLLGITFVWMIAPQLWQRLKNKRRAPLLSGLASAGLFLMARLAGIVFLIVLLPIICLVRAEWLVPQPTREICAVRDFGRRLAEALPDHTRLAVIEHESEGLYTYIVNFELDLEETRTGRNITLGPHIDSGNAQFRRKDIPLYVENLNEAPAATALLIPQAAHSPVTIAGYDNRDSPLVLERDGNSWKRINP